MLDFVCYRSNEIKETDILQYLHLFQTVFTIKKDRAHFHRQFLPGPQDFGYHVFLIDKGEIRGAYSAIPLMFTSAENSYKAALVVDALMHPKYQGRGLLRPLLEVLYDRMRADGFIFLYGMPNRKFYPLLTASLAWEDWGSMQWYIGNPLMGISHTFPDTELLQRSVMTGFENYRFYNHKKILTPFGHAWISRGLLPVLIEFENRSPAGIIKTFHSVCQQLKRPVLLPIMSPIAPGGLLIPSGFRGLRTRIAVKRLVMGTETFLNARNILFTLGDFDVR